MRRAAVLLLGLFVLAGCGDQSMRVQKRYETFAPATVWRDGTAARPLPAGVVAQSDLDRGAAVETPPALTAELLARGRERYDVFCSPCHGVNGEGDGMIVERGFPRPPSYHSDRLRTASGRLIFDVITNGAGAMYAYAARIPPEDRWAIVAYVRALQLSQYARVADLPEVREKLP
jgi:mono/diheme cytochrome c family protein